MAGGQKRRDLDNVEIALGGQADDLLTLDDALTKLEIENRQAADLAKLRLFAGLTVDEAADSLGISRRSGFDPAREYTGTPAGPGDNSAMSRARQPGLLSVVLAQLPHPLT